MGNRESILDRLDEFDNIYIYENKNVSLKVTLDYKNIITNVLWLKDILNLKDVETNLTKCKGIVSKNVSVRQYLCYTAALYQLTNNKLGYSYHEICDFIRDDHLIKNQPISDLEKLLLSTWINLFLIICDEKFGQLNPSPMS